MIYYDEEDVRATKLDKFVTGMCLFMIGFGFGLVCAGLALEMYGKGWVM